MKLVLCHKCGYEWEYSGKSKYYVTCPQCKASTLRGTE